MISLKETTLVQCERDTDWQHVALGQVEIIFVGSFFQGANILLTEVGEVKLGKLSSGSVSTLRYQADKQRFRANASFLSLLQLTSESQHR